MSATGFYNGGYDMYGQNLDPSMAWGAYGRPMNPFYCSWEGPGGSAWTGPHVPHRRLDTQTNVHCTWESPQVTIDAYDYYNYNYYYDYYDYDDATQPYQVCMPRQVHLGLGTFLTCQAPSHEQLEQLNGAPYDRDTIRAFNVTLSVKYLSPTGPDSVELPYTGPRGNDTFTVRWGCDEGSYSSGDPRPYPTGCNDWWQHMAANCPTRLQALVRNEDISTNTFTRYVHVDFPWGAERQQVLCYFEGTAAAGAGWNLVAKMNSYYSGSYWQWNSSRYWDNTSFVDTYASYTGYYVYSSSSSNSRRSAKSPLYSYLRGSEFRLAEMVRCALPLPGRPLSHPP